MYTAYGEFVRVLRVRNHETMGDLQEVLGVSLPFISSVETGKRNVPGEWVDRLVEHFNLSDEERIELEAAIEESRTQYKLTTANASGAKRKMAMQVARSFEGMDDETAMKIMELLNKSSRVNTNGLSD